MGGTNYEEQMNYLVPPSVFHFWKFSRPKFFVVHCISMYFAWFRSIFLRALKFLEIKERGPNFWGEPILQNVWIIWSLFCISILKVLWTQILRHSLDFSPFCMNKEDFSQSPKNFYKLKRGDLISGETNFAESLNYLVPPSVFQS